MELGIYTFGDITPDPNTGRAISIPQRYAEILAAAKLADEAGLDVFGVGEHHRLDIPISSPAVVMAAVAGGTKRIRLTSAVTILSTLDPVRVFQDFATVDLLSGGRAEMIAGRGAYIESFPLFGDDIADYDALFAEKLDLFLKLSASERVTWQGRFRPPLCNSEISPRPVGKLPIWLGVGGNPASALRAGDLGLPLILSNISQPPANFAGQISAYRQHHAESGHDAGAMKVAMATHVHVAKDSQTALEEFYPYYSAYFREHAPRVNLAGEVPRDVYEKRAGATGPIFVGSPQQVIDKLMYERALFAHDRFLAQVDIGGLPYAQVAKSIELLATEVLPAVRGKL
ncbi:MAG: LLM class flavin-dependent oxidoreductase [Roseiarcus sp.]|jgi:alkanesulfonate monooxygenase SsuD/methylene tetrahydromethanopterin reductase-like flavin-dependent oxidoreductase (luciferase family)